MSDRPPGPDGLVVVDKPAGWTSHDVVAKARGLLGTRKVGHAGTLDPDATGVLLLGIGRATRLLRYLSPLGKSYVGDVVLGVETTTLDDSGEVTARFDMAHVALAEVQQVAAERFTGPIEQVPPMVSAVKVGGQRLHKLARAGVTVDRDPRPVTISALTLEAVAGAAAVFRMSVDCSSGTYVRSLAADLGTALGGGAHLRNLRRTAVGPFTLHDAVALDGLGPEAVRPMTDAVRHLASVTAGQQLASAVAVGKVLERDDLIGAGDSSAEDEGPWAVLSESGALLAVYEPHRGSTVKPAVVLALN
ncbi:MAG: tRNA pseudouridine(55) synthase TruB [Actinomycetota bacterium]|nr:tRNA pseudouridine(55) synthase TruB [Actinomycetota bacterium]